MKDHGSKAPPPAEELLYAAVQGCSSCPFRNNPCHQARQHAVDLTIEVGRHYECQYYRALNSKSVVNMVRGSQCR